MINFYEIKCIAVEAASGMIKIKNIIFITDTVFLFFIEILLFSMNIQYFQECYENFQNR